MPLVHPKHVVNSGSLSVYVALFALFPCFIWFVFYPGYYGADDAYIHAAVIESILRGDGWGINPGEPVNLSTAPLFTISMLGLATVFDDMMWAGAIMSLLSTAAYIAGVYVLARKLDIASPFALLAVVIAASNPLLLRWSGTFMEVTHATAGFIWLLVFYVVWPQVGLRRGVRWIVSAIFGALCATLVFLRPEFGVLPVVFLVGDILFGGRRTVSDYVAATVGGSIIAGVYAVWSLDLFGSVVPTTLSAKTRLDGAVGFSSRVVWQIVTVVCVSFPFAGLAAGWACVRIVRDGRVRELMQALRPLFVILALPLVVSAFYIARSNGLQSPARYFVPFQAGLPVVFAAIIALGFSRWPTARLLSAAVLVQLAYALAVTLVVTAPVARSMQDGYVRTMSNAGAVLRETCAPGERVLIAFDLGVISRELAGAACYVVDGGALASPEMRAYRGIARKLRASGADYVVLSLGRADGGTPQWLREEGFGLTLLFENSFPSHGLSSRDRTFVTRVFAVTHDGADE